MDKETSGTGETDEFGPVETSTTDDVKPSGWFAVEADGTIRGWTLDRVDFGRRLTVSIFIDGRPVGTALADRVHAKLLARGEGDGHYAFHFAIPDSFRDGASHHAAVRVITPGYGGFDLKVLDPTFTLAPSIPFPRVEIRWITPDEVHGTLHADKLARQELDLWTGDRRVPDGELEILWEAGPKHARPFVLRGRDIELLPLLVKPFTLCPPGVREALDELEPDTPLRFEIERTADGRPVLRLEGIQQGGGLPLSVRAYPGGRSDQTIGTATVSLRGGKARLPFQIPSEGEILFEIHSARGETLASNVPLSGGQLPRRLTINGTFNDWDAAGPTGYVAGVPATRGYYSFPETLRNGRGLSGRLACFEVPAGAERLLLSQTLPDSHYIGLRATDIGVGMYARASTPTRALLRIVDAGDRVIAEAETRLGARWKAFHETLSVERADKGGSPLRLQLLADGDTGDEGGHYIDLAGLFCGQPDITTFAEQETPANAGQPRKAANLVVNAALRSWPNGLVRTEARKRFECAERWQIFNRAGAKIEVRAIPAPVDDHYALAVRIPSVKDYARLEIPLDTAAMEGTYNLSFEAAHLPAAGAVGSHFAEDRWSTIDRIYILERRDIAVDGAIRSEDTIIAHVARRVLLARDWQARSFGFEIVREEEESEFEEAPPPDGEASYLLALEFRQSANFRIHGVDLRAAADTPAAPGAMPLELEDPAIRSQLHTIKGLEAWAAPTVQRPTAQTGVPATIRPPSRWSWGLKDLGTVEVGICFYNAADETLDCLASLVGSSTVPHTVRIINDGSHEDNRQRVLAFIADKPWMTMEDNGKNRGYTASANRAVLESTADWVILLNSDTVVFPGWIEGLLEVAATHPDTFMIGPVSNAATYQSVPDLYDATGKWAVNALPEGGDAAEVAAFVMEQSKRHFPEVPLLNGFCTMIRRETFAALGGLDERAFPAGYGEENDLCLRARKAGHRLRVADHVYVYHKKSASFGKARRAELSKAGDRVLRTLHGDVDIGALGRSFLETPALVELRETVKAVYAARQGAIVTGKGE